MSLSGWRPAGTSPNSTAISSNPSAASGKKVAVVGSSRAVTSGAPHDEQKLELDGLRWPHWLQKTSSATTSPLDQRTIALGVEQLVKLRGIRGFDDGDPA